MKNYCSEASQINFVKMNSLKEKLDLQPLLTTKKILVKALKEGTSSELEEMGGVQAFEMAYELS
jgi:hypothetical protein